MGEFGEFLFPLICLGLIFCVPYFIFRIISNAIKKQIRIYKSNKEEAKRRKEEQQIIDKYYDIVKNGVSLYNIIKKFSTNAEFSELVSDVVPEFVRCGCVLKIALPTFVSDNTLKYYKESYEKRRNENNAPWSFEFENTIAYDEYYGIEVEESKYAFASHIGRINQTDETECRFEAWVIIKEILRRVKN